MFAKAHVFFEARATPLLTIVIISIKCFQDTTNTIKLFVNIWQKVM